MKNSLLLPILFGVAAAGAIAYFLLSEDTAELREDLSGKLAKGLTDMKEKATEKIGSSFKSAEDTLNS